MASEFLFLYRGGERLKPNEIAQEVLKRWATWLKSLTDGGHIAHPGNPLEYRGKVVSGRNREVVDGPFPEAKDLIGGYTLVKARDLDEAVELSKGCPIFEVNGAVEILPVLKTTP